MAGSKTILILSNAQLKPQDIREGERERERAQNPSTLPPLTSVSSEEFSASFCVLLPTLLPLCF